MPRTTFGVIIIFIEAMYFFLRMDFESKACYSTQLSYPATKAREGFEPSTHKVMENNIKLSSMLCRTTARHYGAIQKRSSGLTLSVFSALRSGHSRGRRFLVPIQSEQYFSKNFCGLTRIRTWIPSRAA